MQATHKRVGKRERRLKETVKNKDKKLGVKVEGRK